MAAGRIEIMQDFILNEEVMNQVKYLGVDETINDHAEHIDELEEIVGILEEGGEPIMGNYVCGRWTQIEENAVHFGRWTPTVLVEST